jgi:hypothetical protein
MEDTMKFSDSTRETRVTLAKDILALLDSEYLHPMHMRYLDIDIFDVANSSTSSLQNILEGTSVCRACALGSLFVGYVRRFNNCNLSDLTMGCESIYAQKCDIDKFLLTIFTKKQLDAIELAYEGTGLVWINDVDRMALSQVEKEHCLEFYKKSADSTERLRAIMNNIIITESSFQTLLFKKTLASRYLSDHMEGPYKGVLLSYKFI